MQSGKSLGVMAKSLILMANGNKLACVNLRDRYALYFLWRHQRKTAGFALMVSEAGLIRTTPEEDDETPND
ncbi:hypothetical protein, partial [Duncaniella sp.]|uniref:hypothetical protein n=1 Tax=Duncaniella sp. TaxID=2518496 RepID=UPI0023CBD8CF